MRLSSPQILNRLGGGESIGSVCAAAGLSREEFDVWWKRETAARLPVCSGTRTLALAGSVRIARDDRGIPHLFAENDEDLFVGFGYATAQDRLFQLDYLRRRALGRLSEVLGPEALELDLVARTVGLPQIAQREWESLPDETRRLVAAFSKGINACIEHCAERLPIEFDLLNYRPQPWRPIDSLAIAGEFRWYLTGRFPVIVIPELAKRTLGAGPLYEALLDGEADAEAILPSGSYVSARQGVQALASSANDPSEGQGSNNWVVSAAKSMTGKPLVASDPHIAFAAVSCWHEVRLSGGSFNVAGMAYAGMPGIIIGRTESVAWGITNNICSIRDLYQERTDADHPGCFQFDGKWEPARERTEIIEVKGHSPVRKTIRLSRNGPIVDEILPAPARATGPVALKWLGASPCGWITALLGMNRARSAEELRRATEPWLVPTFSVVYGDAHGQIGYQCTGRIPIRNVSERGYRPGWDPQHQWAGLIPFEGMPRLVDPPRGWIATANNRVAADDFPYPLSGTWSSGYRAQRIRQMLEGKPRFRRDDIARMQQDSLSLRAVECLPRLLTELHDATQNAEAMLVMPDARTRIDRAVEFLAVWDCRMESDRVAASIFDVFFTLWSERVANERFSGETAALVAGAIGGLAGKLLESDPAGWFANAGARQIEIVTTFLAALDFLSAKLGTDMLDWSWGRLHTMKQQHVLSARGDLAQLLDMGGTPVRGDSWTVCNTGLNPDYTGSMGAGYRMIADLADPQAGLWAVDAGSESGQPGSPHYNDQIGDWLTARYHYLPVKPTGPETIFESELTLKGQR